MSRHPTISLIIPNWNGVVHLKDCFESIRRQTLKPTEVLMIDNGSTDGSCDLARQIYPEVKIISLPSNKGFAFAVNRGIGNATGRYIALLNNDVELDKRWLETLAAAIESDSSAGSAACKMMNFYDRSIIDAAGDGLSRFGSPFSRGHGELDRSQYDRKEHIFGACAGAALFRRDLFERIGTFDEEFISYYEDVDLSFRAQLAGFKCVYEPASICYHKRGATGNKVSEYPVRMGERNLTAFLIKDFPAPFLILWLPFIAASRIRRIYRSVNAGLGRGTFKGLLEGVLLIPSMLKKRKRVQRSRTVKLSYISSLLGKRATT